MCGRYVVVTPPGQLAIEFEAALDEASVPADREPDYNVAPTKSVPAVLQRDGARTLTALRWGLIPFWAKDPAIGSRMINARVETAAEKPVFRQAFARRRCLVPADGYYEWRKSDQPKGRKQPFFIHRSDDARLAFAGLYERWRDPEGNDLWTVSIMTGAAPAGLDLIHDRIPLTVPSTGWTAWLDPDLRDAEEARGLLDLTPGWVARPIGTRVNSVANNGPDLVEPAGEEIAQRSGSGMGEAEPLF
ncbi:MAG TPA: SOS response-associated peptidase [Actinocrinis sp.]|jgi:putative SOS response-associated peptidase YedK